VYSAASREFIEQRKKSLRRYLNIVARHPQMYDDKLVRYFLTFTGNVSSVFSLAMLVDKQIFDYYICKNFLFLSARLFFPFLKD